MSLILPPFSSLSSSSFWWSPERHCHSFTHVLFRSNWWNSGSTLNSFGDPPAPDLLEHVFPFPFQACDGSSLIWTYDRMIQSCFFWYLIYIQLVFSGKFLEHSFICPNIIFLSFYIFTEILQTFYTHFFRFSSIFLLILLFDPAIGYTGNWLSACPLFHSLEPFNYTFPADSDHWLIYEYMFVCTLIHSYLRTIIRCRIR